MPFNLLLIPLLGGYIFVRFWNYTKIIVLRADKDRILIRASIAGFFSLTIAFAISTIVPTVWPCPAQGHCLYSWWKENIPFEYMGVSLIAFLISSTSWMFLNLFCSMESSIDRAIKEDADPLEITLKESADFELPLAITLIDGKVYVGIVTHQFNPATPTNNIAILPLQSGYRDSETKELHLKINYAVIIQQMVNQLDNLSRDAARLRKKHTDAVASEDKALASNIAENEQNLLAEWDELKGRLDLFEVVIPVNRIASVFYFDEMIYDEHFGPTIDSSKA